MTDDPDEGPFIPLHFHAHRETLEKLTVVAATQGMSVDTAINTAMHHYEMTMGVEPGKVLRWQDADNQTRRVYLLPSGYRRTELAMTIGVVLMVAAAPLCVIISQLFLIWAAGAMIFLIAWVHVQLKL